MKCKSTRFGSFDVSDESILHFPSGLLGFHDQSRYVILDHDTPVPFKWLQSVTDPDLSFVIMDPVELTADYSLVLTPEALAEVKGLETDDLLLLVILTIPSEDPGSVTANLRGPLVVNQRTKMGKQVVLADSYPTRHPVFPRAVPIPEPAAPSLQQAACS
ncbi:Flagellar assembly factor FliW [Nitrospira sp. KM1]|uniref:flagellar assembly protein FliW n=1 Tax=Nitrospira sp. KM1 TaxID=1936990 RepID=UPI0013A78A3E|nr:flagellar assembly protein FliW [Nitrospira sp. KM1]BCA54785.1 Flagellar assembly factor FliW [Nitrospira sp. KM1]